MKQICLLLLSLLISSCSRQNANSPLRHRVRPIAKIEPSAHKKPPIRTTIQQAKKASSTPTPLRICIDPGHGGHDDGAKAVIAPFMKEKVLALKTALKVQEFLTRWGYSSCMTRKNDVFIPLLDRVAFAQKQKCTLFVSIHYNSTPKPTAASGVEIYYFGTGKDKARMQQSKKLAHCILLRMTPATRTANRGVHHGNFAVVRETTMPAVLVETGFLSNPSEAKKFKNPNYIKFLAWSIAKGIEDYIEHE